MVTEPFPELDEPTVSDLRSRIRELIEAETAGGYHPLRKHEKHRAYYCLEGSKVIGSPSSGEVSYRLLQLLVEKYDADFELRDPFDANGPLSKAELTALEEALRGEADE